MVRADTFTLIEERIAHEFRKTIGGHGGIGPRRHAGNGSTGTRADNAEYGAATDRLGMSLNGADTGYSKHHDYGW